MNTIVVGISDCRVSAEADASLITYGLGSCIAVILHDPGRRVGGMLHYMLPDSALDATKAVSNPFIFADTGIPLLFERVKACGGDTKKATVRLVGGAQVLDPNNVFGIGRRNYLAAKKVLWKLGALVSSEAIGGDQSRTVRLDVATGRSWLREGGHPESDLGATHSPPELAIGEGVLDVGRELLKGGTACRYAY